MLHVVKVLRGFYVDGPGRLVLGLLSQWQPEELKVSVVALSDSGALREPIEEQVARLGGTVEVFPAGWRDVPAAGRHVAAWASARGASLLHGHLLRADAVGRMAAKRAKLPYVVTEHGLHSWSERGPLLRPIVKYLYRRNIRKGMAVVAVSEKTARQLLLEGVPRQAVELIRNGVDLHRFRPVPEHEQRLLRESLGIPPTAFPVMAQMGALARHKDPMRSVKLLAHLRAVADWQPWLLMAGDGPQRMALEDKARELGVADRVLFLGQMAGPELAYGAADLLVHPSRQESYGLAVAEALASGLPAVVRAGAGSDALLPPWPLSVAVDGDDPQVWAASVRSLAEQLRAHPRETQRGLRVHAEQNLSLAHTARGYVALYRKLCGLSR